MNLQVSVVLLFISLTGGYSLKCYSCTPDLTGSCAAKEETCLDGVSKCFTVKSIESITVKGCTPLCVPATMSCCDTDLCNAADGVYKGSFLLLVSPLLFYFLFQ
ncbi:hypothetical protein PO909_030227 [Leuciscus waleckii]